MSAVQDPFVELQQEFLEEAIFLVEQCEESYLKLDNPDCRSEELAKIFRLAHSIKGAGAAVGFQDLADLAHIVEDCLSILRAYPERVNRDAVTLLLQAGDAFKVRLAQLRAGDQSPWEAEGLKAEIRRFNELIASGPALLTPEQILPLEDAPPAPAPAKPAVPPSLAVVPPPPSMATTPAPAASVAPAVAHAADKGAGDSIKIKSERVENVLNIVGELVVIKSQLMNLCQGYSQDLRLNAVVSLMDKTVRELQEQTLSMRMTPMKSLFLKAQRIVRDLSGKLGKDVDFKMSGEETELDRTTVELLADPLMHLVRNALDHGIETKEKRQANGKPAKGIINLSAYQAGGRVILEIRDDGNGIHRDRILNKARERGLISEQQNVEAMTDQQVFQYLFMPGFSTVEKVTDLSGRGVGMDVVKTNIETMKGSIEIASQAGRGSSFTLSLPLTSSITDGMIVEVAGESFIVPIESIKELVESGSQEQVIETENGKTFLRHRDRVLPLFDLAFLFLNGRENVSGRERRGSTVIITESLGETIALRVHRVLGQTQVVLKPLGPYFQDSAGLSGVAILGDGRAALVIDPGGIQKIKRGVAC